MRYRKIVSGMFLLSCLITLLLCLSCTKKNKNPISDIDPDQIDQLLTEGSRLTGILLKEAESAGLVKRLGKNAQGFEKMTAGVPANGADVLIYDAESMSSTSIEQCQTDSLGKWSADVPPGQYFIFFVYFDIENMEFVTSVIQSISADSGKVVTADTNTAISDEVSPMVMAFVDASSPNEYGVLMASDVPSGMPLVIAFSEPMNRSTVGDSVQGIVLGEVDPADGELALINTVPLHKMWSPSGKELMLTPATALTIGKTYKVVIPTSVKDLALNKLDQTYYGVFKVIDPADLPPFAIQGTSIKNGETIDPGKIIELTFTRPIDQISIMKNASVNPAIPFFFESKGKTARLVNAQPWARNTAYTLTIGAATLDLLGSQLGTPATLAFTVSAPDSFEAKDGVSGELSTWVKMVMNAFISGDFETFAAAFNDKFEAIEVMTKEGSSETSEQRQTRDVFLAARRNDMAWVDQVSNNGIITPKWYFGATNDKPQCIKLINGAVVLYMQDMGNNGGVGATPQLFDASWNVIDPSMVKFSDSSIIYQNANLIFKPNMDAAFLGDSLQANHPDVYGRLLAEQTNVETRNVKVLIKQTVNIKTVNIAMDSGFVMFEMIQTDSFPTGDRPWPVQPGQATPLSETNVMAIQIKAMKDGARWTIMNLFSKEVKDPAASNAFAINTTVSNTPGIDLVTPAQFAAGVKSPVAFVWSHGTNVMAGGYLFVISNDVSGGNEGLIVFTRNKTITIDAATGEVSGGTVLNVGPETFMVPLQKFGMRMTSISATQAYSWKVMAVPDTSSSSLLSGQIRVSADSDFGNVGLRLGIFTMAAVMPDIKDVQMVPQNNVNQFSDRDGDFVPDAMENAYGTNPDDPSSWPNFGLDSDKDGYPDFMEAVAGSDPELGTSMPVDNNKNGIADALEAATQWNPIYAVDDDKDGYPNEIEIMCGTDPWNAGSVPREVLKSSIPADEYIGMLQMDGENEPYSIGITVYIDEGKDMAVIDSTSLETIRVGTASQLTFVNGEWVMLAQILYGPNTGKTLKFRLNYSRDASGNGIVQGNIDMTDGGNTGGQLVGRFMASTSGQVDLNNPNNNQQPGNQQTGNTIVAPPDNVKNLPDSTIALSMAFVYDAAAKRLTSVTAFDPTDTVVSTNANWNPGFWPALRADANDATGNTHIEAEIFKDESKVYLSGRMNGNENGGWWEVQFVVSTTNLGAVDNPSGTWTGAYWSSTNTPAPGGNEWPMPFIGKQAVVTAALALTVNRGFHQYDSVIVNLTNPMQDMPPNGPWHAEDAEKSGRVLFILENPEHVPDSVMIVDVPAALGGGKAILVRDMAGGSQTTGFVPFTGTVQTAVAELTAKASDAQALLFNPATQALTPVMINIVDITSSPNGNGGTIIVVKDRNNSATTYVLAGDSKNPATIAYSNGDPVVLPR